MAGPLVTAYPELRATTDVWIDHKDMWLARTAILHQLRYKGRTDASLLFDFCQRRGEDKEFFLQKAIGWALREYSKTDPDAVRSFVDDMADRLSPLSRREAPGSLAGVMGASKRRSGSVTAVVDEHTAANTRPCSMAGPAMTSARGSQSELMHRQPGRGRHHGQAHRHRVRNAGRGGAGARRARRGPRRRLHARRMAGTIPRPGVRQRLRTSEEHGRALLLGRRTYEIFANYWPTAPEEIPFTGLLNAVPKLVAQPHARRPPVGLSR